MILYNKCSHCIDVALLHLDKPFDLNKNFHIVYLPSSVFLQGENIDAIFNKCTVVGFALKYQYKTDKESRLSEARMKDLMEIEIDISVNDDVRKGVVEENKDNMRVDGDNERKDDDGEKSKGYVEGYKRNIKDDESEFWRKNVGQNGWKDKERGYFTGNAVGLSGSVKEGSGNKHPYRRNDENGRKVNESKEESEFFRGNEGNIERYRENIKESDEDKYLSKINIDKSGWKSKRDNTEIELFEETKGSRESKAHAGSCNYSVGHRKSFWMSWLTGSRGVEVVPEDVGAPVLCGELQFGVVQSSFMRNGTLVVMAAQVDFDIPNFGFSAV